MAGESKPTIQTLERVGSKFLNRLATLGARDRHDILGYASSHKAPDKASGVAPRAFVVDGFEVSAQATPAMSVQVGLGIGFAMTSGLLALVQSPQNESDESNLVMMNKRVVTPAVAINAAHATLTRYDLIEVKKAVTPDTTEADESLKVDLWDDILKDFVLSGANSVTKRHGEPDIHYTAGVAGFGVPNPTAGRIPIAVVMVFANDVAIPQTQILDARIFFSEVNAKRAEHSSYIDVSEFSIDVPAGATDASTQNMTVHAEVRAGGIPGAVRTPAAIDVRSASYLYYFLDRITLSNLFANLGPEWMYAYIVTADDQGLRLSTSSSSITGHQSVGVFMFSHTPPSLVNGSMAPSAALNLPGVYGAAGTCTPGVGKAICIGAFKYGGPGATKRFTKAVRGQNGKYTIADNTTIPLVLQSGAQPSFAAEGTATTTTSEYYSAWGNGANPVGPLTFDVMFGMTVGNVTAQLGQLRRIEIAEGTGVGTDDRKVAEAHVTIASATGTPTSTFSIFAPEMGVGRTPAVRGTTKSGFHIYCTCRYTASATGAGLADPGGGTPPSIGLVGWRWPQGAAVL